MPESPGVLARGSWEPSRVDCRWREERFEPEAAADAEADAAIADLRRRGSPAHDGLSARLAGYSAAPERLSVELQPARWSLRLADDAAGSLAALCVTRAADGRWLAGRRAAWLASWAGRWALGAGGAVDVSEHPADTLARELREEWSVAPDRLTVEALVRNPRGLVLFVGMAWLPEGAEVAPDEEHDAFAWWPSDVASWPEEADAPLRWMASLLSS